MTKIVAITDIHSGKDRKSLTHPDYFRQNNNQASKEIKNLPKYLPEKIDLYLQMGDLIRNTNDNDFNDQETKNITNTLNNTFSNVKHFVGNHDRLLNNLPIIENISNYDFETSRIIIINSKNDLILSRKEVDILKNLVVESNNKPILIFTHIPIFPINSGGNFYFYQKEENQFCKNYQKILKLFKTKSNVFVISGHLHWISSTEISPNIRQITLPAFCENIITTPKCDIHPCVYNLIEIDKKILTIKSYSRQFCFGSLEFNLK